MNIPNEQALKLVGRLLAKHVTAMPRMEISPFPSSEGQGDEEIAVLMVSDLQTGLKFTGFNSHVLRERVRKLAIGVEKVVSLHRRAYPVRRLAVFALGDMVHNDRIGRVISLDELEKVVMEQVFDVASPCLSELLVTLRQTFEMIDVYTVDGNHGSLGKYAAVKTNWDNVVYRTCELQLAQYPEIRWHIEKKEFWQKVKLGKWVFLLTHGDSIPMHLTLPWYGITTRAMRWQGSLPGRDFQYLCMGHFHTASSLDWNEMEVFVNGAFVTSNGWVLKKLGLASSTVQWFFGVHPRRGVTFRYKIRLK